MRRFIADTDWFLLGSAVLISIFGLVTMYGFGGQNQFAERQILWLIFGVGLFFMMSVIDFRFLRRTGVVVGIYGVAALLLALLFIIGAAFQGSARWFDLGFFAFQPSEFAKLALIIVLAKYFSRRHIEIAHFRHIIVSFLYAGVIFFLLFLQPDFGSGLIVLAVWGGIILIAGIPPKRLVVLGAIAAIAAAGLWFFALADYQKARIVSFMHPLADIQGAGYNAFQSTVAVGSGGILGKGIGYGTQSRLQFLPEHQTDFIFAAFAEEWGLGGALFLIILFGIIFWRISENARVGATNFETLFILGVGVLLLTHTTIHIGMNIGLLPITGTTLPFMSYGGSHMLITYATLGIINAMRRYARAVHEDERHEVVGV